MKRALDNCGKPALLKTIETDTSEASAAFKTICNALAPFTKEAQERMLRAAAIMSAPHEGFDL